MFVEGANLSTGDMHFSQGDGEVSFCGAIEMSGFLELKYTVSISFFMHRLVVDKTIYNHLEKQDFLTGKKLTPFYMIVLMHIELHIIVLLLCS